MFHYTLDLLFLGRLPVGEIVASQLKRERLLPLEPSVLAHQIIPTTLSGRPRTCHLALESLLGLLEEVGGFLAEEEEDFVAEKEGFLVEEEDFFAEEEGFLSEEEGFFA